MKTRGLAAKVNKAAFAVMRFPLINSSHHVVLGRGPTGSGSISMKAASVDLWVQAHTRQHWGHAHVFLSTRCGDAVWGLCNAHKNTV